MPLIVLLTTGLRLFFAGFFSALLMVSNVRRVLLGVVEIVAWEVAFVLRHLGRPEFEAKGHRITIRERC